jgi:hypothetical protein
MPKSLENKLLAAVSPKFDARLLRIAASSERLCNIAEGTQAVDPRYGTIGVRL